MQRDLFGADPRAFAAVGTPSRHVEGTDNMEQLLLEAIRRRLLRHTRFRVIKHAFFTAARGTDVPAGVTADAAGKLRLPEGVPLILRHPFQRLHLFKAAAVAGRRSARRVLTEKLVINHRFFLTAQAALLQNAFPLDRAMFVRKRLNEETVVLPSDRQDPVSRRLCQKISIRHPVAGDRHRVDLLSCHPMLGKQLVQAVAVAGLQENQHSSRLFRLGDEIF